MTAREGKPVAVLVADALPVIAAGIRTELEHQPNVEVVGEATDVPSAVALARVTRSDVAVVDSDLPPSGCGELIRRLSTAAPGSSPKVIVMAGSADSDQGVVISAGASAVVAKSDILNCLAPLVRLVALTDLVVLQSRRPLGLRWSAGGPGPVPSAATQALTTLTDREREVLLLIARGLGCRQVAASLGVREATARSHLHHLLHKLSLRDRAHAVAFAYESGLVRPATAHGGTAPVCRPATVPGPRREFRTSARWGTDP